MRKKKKATFAQIRHWIQKALRKIRGATERGTPMRREDEEDGVTGERIQKRLKRRDEAAERWETDIRLPAGSFHPSNAAASAADQNFCTEYAEALTPLQPVPQGLDQAPPEKNVDVSVGEFVELGDILTWLESRVDDFITDYCKTVPTGRLFPLPTSPYVLGKKFPQKGERVLSVLRCLTLALNSMNGEGLHNQGEVSEYQGKVLSGLLEDCERVETWKAVGPMPTWKEFFRVKGVDYKGEEVLTAQTMRWENVAPALPIEVGSVPLEDLVDLGCKYYVENFEDFLLDPKDQVAVKPPRVLVPPDGWAEFCSHLLDLGVFSRVHEDDLYRVQQKPLLNGLFGVSKQEFNGPTEIHRIIMNLVPLNNVCRGFDGDVSTLPAWAGMAPLHLQPHEDLLVSSEDVRAFFYIFRVPKTWHRFLAFNRELPPELCGEKSGRWYPCSAVLPMGFKNSVSLAQHVHRFVVKQALQQVGLQGGEAELRKDRPFSVANPVHRVYLDNFDELERTSKEMAATIQGKLSPVVQALQEVYAALGIPRHPKKGVARSLKAEVQGAIVDGALGLAYPKVEKVLRYAHLARLLLEEDCSSQKQMQIVGGGFVYIAMFRRPLLGGLNHLWEFIVEAGKYPPVVKLSLPEPVKQELARFLGLIPMAYMDFRATISEVVTASDASEAGGGVTASTGVTSVGAVASQCSVRGDIVEPADITGVLTIGIFDGIGALRMAADALGWNVLGHVSIEKSQAASRVVESRFPGTAMSKM
eukprot:s309_g13.t1